MEKPRSSSIEGEGGARGRGYLEMERPRSSSIEGEGAGLGGGATWRGEA